MSELIEKLEAASKGSVELDHEIGRHINRLPLKFTRSIGAALTLVPEGWYWNVDSSGTASVADIGKDYRVQAETPTLALCIAALKARESSDG